MSKNIKAEIEDLALHAEMVNNILLQEVKLEQFEVDEMWTFVKKNKKKLSLEAQIQMSKVRVFPFSRMKMY